MLSNEATCPQRWANSSEATIPEPALVLRLRTTRQEKAFEKSSFRGEANVVP